MVLQTVIIIKIIIYYIIILYIDSFNLTVSSELTLDLEGQDNRSICETHGKRFQ